MKPRDADIVEAEHFISEDLCRDGRLLRHRDVARAPGRNHDPPNAVRLGDRPDDPAAGHLPVIELDLAPDDRGRLLAHPRDEDRLLAGRLHGLHDPDDLLRGLAGPVNDLRSPLSDLPVQVHLGVADVLKGLLLEREQRIVHRKAPILHVFEYFSDVVRHFLFSRFSETDL